MDLNIYYSCELNPGARPRVHDSPPPCLECYPTLSCINYSQLILEILTGGEFNLIECEYFKKFQSLSLKSNLNEKRFTLF